MGNPSENQNNRTSSPTNYRIRYYKILENGKESLELNLTTNERNCINNAIREGIRYHGYYWKKEYFSQDVKDYYDKISSYNLDYKEIFSKVEGENYYISNYGVIKFDTGELYVGYKVSEGRRMFKHKFLHRIVAETFIIKRKLLPGEVIDHINTDPSMNFVTNLKVTDQTGNMNNSLTKQKLSTKVKQYTLDGIFVKEWNSILDAAKETVEEKNFTNISRCCRDKVLSAGGFLWVYSGEEFKLPKLVQKIKERKYISPISNIKQYSLEGKFIKEFKNIKEANLSLNIDHKSGSIGRCCRDKSLSAHGYLWCYSGQEDTIPDKVKRIKKKSDK